MNEKFFLPITLAICVLVSFGWYKFIYEPARSEILSMELETRRLREVEREISELKARHGNFTAFVTAKELQLDKAKIFLPPTLAQEEFIDGLYQAADFSKARIISVHTGEEIQDKEVLSQAVNVIAEADYISLLNFIRIILDGERLATLEKFSVDSVEGNILSCSLSFKIFATVP